MSDRKYQFSVGEVLLWLSLFAMAVALRFDPHLPFLLTMLGLGLALAIRMRQVGARAAIRSSLFAGLALGPALLCMGLYVKMLDWPDAEVWWEVGSAVVVGAYIGSLISSAGGLIVVGLGSLGNQFPGASRPPIPRRQGE